MTLPEVSEGKYPLLKPGKYTFRITDPPEMRRYGKATGIIIKFTAINEFGEAKDNSVLEGQEQQKIVNIRPFPKADGPITKDTTPPPEEEDDPGPEEEDPYPKEKDDSEPPF
jgi:hypothetical protein